MEIVVTDNGIDEFGGVWVIARGPANCEAEINAVRRACATHARKNGYGRWISSGCSFESGGTVVEWRVRYSVRCRSCNGRFAVQCRTGNGTLVHVCEECHAS
jgi:hypothetical protein